MPSTFNDFKRDLVRGRDGETVVQEFLRKEFKIETVNKGKENPYWDLDGRDSFSVLREAGKDVSNYKKYGTTYEVKTDDTSKRTKNFYFEVWSNKDHLNPGCISACKADTIVIVSGDTLYFLNRALFYTWVFENLYFNTDICHSWRKRTAKIGGAGKLASAKQNPDVQGILIPLEHIEKSFACIGIFKV